MHHFRAGNTCGVASFPPPVFDPLQHANMEGEGLGDLATCGGVRWTESRHMGGRGGGGGGGGCRTKNLTALL